ncbi:hypothetical protein BAE44_0008969, partial [Dichanthelium oligosanthes]
LLWLLFPLCISAGAESFHHYLLIRRIFFAFSLLSPAICFFDSDRFFPSVLPSLYSCMDCWYSQSFQEHMYSQS